MTVTLELNPELQEQIAARAEAVGMTTEAYLLSVIHANISLPATQKDASLNEFEAFLDALAEDSNDLPVLLPDDLTREAIYGDHD